MSQPALELQDVSKRFGSVIALESASIVVKPGSIHALLGENGAGKTTLMRIAFGMVQPNSGTISLGGVPTRIGSPADAIAAGIGMVHQQFSLIPAMTVAENVALGGSGRFRPGDIASRILEIGKKTGLTLNPSSIVADLSSAEKQKLEILRIFAHEARVLILDEPTAVLTPRDTGELFNQLRAFASSGGSVVLITHKLHDALAHADEVTVLRRGKVVLASAMAVVDRATLTEAMLGFTPDATAAIQPHSQGRVVAACHNVVLAGTRNLRSIPLSFEVQAGEILGVAALDGGASGLLRTVAGRLAPLSGTVTAPERIGFVPENRLDDALVPEFSLTENFALRGAAERTGVLPWERLEEDAGEILRDFDVRADGPGLPAGSLSGGNQQRFVLGRELYDEPSLLVLENPTQGLDVNAMGAIHDRIRVAAANGTAVLFYSSDLDELAEISDRVLVAGDSGIAFSDPDRESIGNLLLR
jgi:simple sugar transport system ATP-binding protein